MGSVVVNCNGFISAHCAYIDTQIRHGVSLQQRDLPSICKEQVACITERNQHNPFDERNPIKHDKNVPISELFHPSEMGTRYLLNGIQDPDFIFVEIIG